jgi:Cof subfamily protein (haloacid dehalogenase superfamily)
MKLLVFDVDDTLVPMNKILPRSTIEAIGEYQAKGNPVAIASGRPYHGIAQYLSLLAPGEKYAIAANGAAVHEEKGAVLFQAGLRYADFASFVSRHPEIMAAGGEIYCYTLDGVGYLRMSQAVRWEASFNNIPVRDLSAQPLADEDPILKFMAVGAKEIIDRIALTAEDRRFHIIKSDPRYLEFVNPGADKAVGVEFLRKRLGLTKDEVYCFGDQGNDLLMIKNYQGVAMGNAIPECKRVAKFVTLSVDEDGVSYALRHFVG